MKGGRGSCGLLVGLGPVSTRDGVVFMWLMLMLDFAGIDMIAHYCQKRFGHEFVDTFALQMLELNPGGKASQFYE